MDESYIRKASDNAWTKVMGTPHGRDVLIEILSYAAVYRDPKEVYKSDTDYRLGQQSVGRHVINRMYDMDLEMYPKLLIEMGRLPDGTDTDK